MSIKIFSSILPECFVGNILKAFLKRKRLGKASGKSIQKLKSGGLKTDLLIVTGNPKHIIAEVAEKRHADMIFVGANRFGTRLDRFMIGSVSAAVAARAHCSVEVVRKN